MSRLSAAIRDARAGRGFSQAELAARLGVSQGTISFWENGVETPTFKNLVKLAVELPELTVAIEDHELNLLQRLRQLEHEVLGQRCGCRNCTCQSPV